MSLDASEFWVGGRLTILILLLGINPGVMADVDN